MSLVLSHATSNSEGSLMNVCTENRALAAPGVLPGGAALLLVYCTGMRKG